MLGRTKMTGLVLAVLLVGLVITALNIYQLHNMQTMHFQQEHGPYPEGKPGTDAGQVRISYSFEYYIWAKIGRTGGKVH